MFQQWKRRGLCILMSLALIGQLLGGFAVSAEGETSALPKKILLIGNSYSIDAMRFLPKILIQEGVTEFTIGYLYYPGCTLNMHLNYAQNDSTVYSYYKTTGSSSFTKTSNSTLLYALQDVEWDEIYLQQGPMEAARPSTYSKLGELIDYINEHKTNPEATFGFHMTWAYAARYATAGEYYSAAFGSDFGGDPVAMFNAISSTVQETIVNGGQAFAAGIVPCGTAIANTQSSYIGDATDRDGYHRSALGQLIAGYTWFCHLTGRTLDEVRLDVTANTYDRISGTSSGTGALIDLSAEDREVVREAVNNAIASPWVITPSTHAAPARLKVLAIGNSYSKDDMAYLYDVAHAHGVQEIVLGNLYKSGCALSTHWSNAQNDTAAYTYYKNTTGEWQSTENATLLDGIQDEDWDIITIQQASQYSGRSATYSDLDSLIGYVNTNKTNADAKVVWNMTQAYQNGYVRSEFEEYYNNSQDTMFKNIASAVKSKVAPKIAVFRVIPTGTAIQNVRGSYIGDNLNRDGTHLNDLGRFIAAYTWYMELTNSRPDTLLLGPVQSELLSDTFSVSDSDKSAIRSAIVSAIENPYKVSESEFDIPVVELEDLDVFFINGVAQPGAYNEVVVLHSDVLPAVGMKAKVLLPASADTYEHSYNSELKSRFWHMQDGVLKRAYGVWYTKPARGTFGYHEKFIALDSEKMTIAHATGCTGSGAKCRYGFSDKCEYTDGARSTVYECGKLVKNSNPQVYTVTLADPVTVIDLRSGVANPVNSLEGLEELAQTGEVVMNLYCSTPHQVTAVLVLDLIANFDVSVSQPEHGTVAVSPAAGRVGDTVTVTATPDAGYELYDITVDGQPISGNTFTISGSHTVSAVFDLPIANTANMRLSESLDFYMYVPTGGKTYTLDSVTVGSRAVTDAQMASDGGNYKITVPVFAKEMADDVVAVLTDANGRTHAVTDSVKEYAGRILSTSESATEKTMMADMLVYGAAAQTYFDYNTAALATEGVDLSAATPALDLSTVYDPGNTDHPLAYHSANLTLEERIDFAMYFWVGRIGTDKSYTYTVTSGGTPVANGNGTFSEKLDGADGYLYEVHISGLKLSAMSGAVISLTYHEKDGNIYTAKDSLANYLYRNEGLAINDMPQSYTLNPDGSIQWEGTKTGTDSSDLYAKIMAFAASSAQYAAEFDQPVGPVAPVEYTLVDGDVIFIPGAAKSGKQSEGYILNSATLDTGTKAIVTIPAGTSKADGSTHLSSANQSSGRFWVMSGETLIRAEGTYEDTSSPLAYKFGYHDTLKYYHDDPALNLAQIEHASGHKGYGSDCTYKFDVSCGVSTTTYRYRECSRRQTVTDDLVILDLRSAVLAGTANKVTTVAEVIALSDGGSAVVNTYVPDGIASTTNKLNHSVGTTCGTIRAIIVIDHTPVEEIQPVGPVAPAEYTLVADDVIFIPGAAKSGEQSEGYIVNSATLAAGTKVLVTVPTTANDDANGSTPDSSSNKASGYFWRKYATTCYRATGVWDGATTARAYKFGYHDKITAYTADSITLDHADGHKSTGVCTYNFSNACGDSSTNRYSECARKQTVNESTLILDLRSAVLAGTETAVTTVAEIKALTDAGTAVVNTYVPDGVSVGTNNSGTSSAGGTAAAIIVIDHTPVEEIQGDAEQILAERRDAAEAYMRRTMSVLWKMDEDFLYTTADNITPEQAPTTGLSRLLIKGGRIYRGTMYSYASGTMDSFLEYATGEPENGVYTIANLPWQAVSGGYNVGARVGNDCTSSIGLAWASFGANSITIANSKTMGPSKGYLRVGEYQSSDTDNTHSENITAANGEQVMYAAYAQLKKADAIVHRDASSGHGIMIVSSDPVYNTDGTINGKTSTVTVLEQGRGAFKNENHYYDEKLKSEVYYFGGLDNVYTYESIMKGGYLPVTCKELINAAPIADPVVKDSCTDPLSKDTLLTGKISCNWMIDCVTMTITDSVGAQVQKGALRSIRYSNFAINLQQFKTEKATSILGRIAPDELAAGNYHCKLVCRLVSGQEFTVRDFDFTV